jgi:hypothetical protein
MRRQDRRIVEMRCRWSGWRAGHVHDNTRPRCRDPPARAGMMSMTSSRERLAVDLGGDRRSVVTGLAAPARSTRRTGTRSSSCWR